MKKIVINSFLTQLDPEYLADVLAATTFVSMNSWPHTVGEIRQHLVLNIKHQERLDGIRHAMDHYAGRIRVKLRLQENTVKSDLVFEKKRTRAETESDFYKDPKWTDINEELESLVLCASRINNLIWMLKASYSYIAGTKI